ADICATTLGYPLDLIPAGGVYTRSRLHQLGAERNHATKLLRCILLAGVRATLNQMNFETGRGLDDTPDAIEVIDSGQLDEDLIAAEVVLLNHGLADTEGVDALADDGNRLIERVLLNIRLSGGLHGQRPGAAVSAG